MGFYSEGGSSTPVGPTPPIVELDPVISRTNTPPGGPATGDRYLIATAPTGAWVGHASQIAEWSGAAWGYTSGTLNDYVYVTNTLTTYRFNGTIWVVSSAAAILQNGNSFGSAGVRIGTNDVRNLYFKTAGIVRVIVTSGGNFGIGTTAPGGKFEVVHATSGKLQVFDNGYFKNEYNANNYLEYVPASGTPVTVYTSTATVAGFKAVNTASSLEMRSGNGQQQILFTDYMDIYPGGSGSPVHRFNSSGAFGVGTGTNTIGARLQSNGTGTSSAAYSFIAADSTNTTLFSVRNDGKIFTTSNHIDLLQLGFTDYGVGVDGNGYVVYHTANPAATVTGHRFGKSTGSSFTELAKIESNLSTYSLFTMSAVAGQTLALFQLLDSSSANLFTVKGDGNISAPALPVGNAGLSSGDLYVDTAANILANGDKIVARKV